MESEDATGQLEAHILFALGRPFAGVADHEADGEAVFAAADFREIGLERFKPTRSNWKGRL